MNGKIVKIAKAGPVVAHTAGTKRDVVSSSQSASKLASLRSNQAKTAVIYTAHAWVMYA